VRLLGVYVCPLPGLRAARLSQLPGWRLEAVQSLRRPAA
jgi:hypothetical protein